MYIRKFRITRLTFTALLLVFLYNSMGYFFIFKCLQSDIKEQVAQNIQSLSSNALKIIAFNKKDIKKINWIEEKEEMRYDGEMYDVAKTRETSDSIIYYCMSDENEDRLYSELEDHVTNHVILPESNPASKKITSESINLYFTDEYHFSFDLTSSSLSHLSIHSNYLPVYIERDAPPPKSDI
jgi:hypothetical protein